MLEKLGKKYILGVDPSGSYDEGKGTTGWNITDSKTHKILEVDSISALDYNSNHEYWEAHIDLLKTMCKRYGFDWGMSIENYILYESAAMAQVNSQLETVQLLGIMKQFCYQYAIPYRIRPAVAVKTRWTNEILAHKKIIISDTKGGYYAPCRPEKNLCTHELDAIRHATHCSMFEN